MKLLIAAGATGGHLFPGLAVAEVLKEMDPSGEVVFVGSAKGLEREILAGQGFHYEALNVGRLKGEGWSIRFKTLLGLPLDLVRAVRLIRRLRPNAVFGLGGYVSGPILLAAALLKIPSAVLEPNAIPGFTNRILARFVNFVFVSFPQAESFFSKAKVKRTGTPVRKTLTAIGQEKENKNNVTEKRFTLAVLGGSQGASSLNKAVVRLLEILKNRKEAFRVLHQSGKNDLGWVSEAYASAPKISSEVKSFFSDMESVYAQADLVISRAGASTLAELMATRSPSLLVPYPFAADDHQKANALFLSQRGAAETILQEDLEEKLAERVLYYVEHPEALTRMRERLAEMQKAPAADVVTRECLKLALAS